MEEKYWCAHNFLRWLFGQGTKEYEVICNFSVKTGWICQEQIAKEHSQPESFACNYPNGSGYSSARKIQRHPTPIAIILEANSVHPTIDQVSASHPAPSSSRRPSALAISHKAIHNLPTLPGSFWEADFAYKNTWKVSSTVGFWVVSHRCLGWTFGQICQNIILRLMPLP